MIVNDYKFKRLIIFSLYRYIGPPNPTPLQTIFEVLQSQNEKQLKVCAIYDLIIELYITAKPHFSLVLH